MVRLYPAALWTADNDGRLPLLYALEKRRLFETVQVFVDAFLGAVTLQDSRGRLPLYIACNRGASLDVIYKLARWAPDFLPTLNIADVLMEGSRNNGKEQECSWSELLTIYESRSDSYARKTEIPTESFECELCQ